MQRTSLTPAATLNKQREVMVRFSRQGLAIIAWSYRRLAPYSYSWASQFAHGGEGGHSCALVTPLPTIDSADSATGAGFDMLIRHRVLSAGSPIRDLSD